MSDDKLPELQDAHGAEPRSPAEAALRRWLQLHLADRVTVLSNVLLTDLSGRLEDAEVDVVLLDPAWGVLCVEVKGGPVSYDARHGRWWRALPHGGRREVRDPVEQAKRASRFVKRAVEQAAIHERIPIGWVVAVPDVRMEAPGGSYLPQGRLWDALAAEELDRLYVQAVHSFSETHARPGQALCVRIASVLRGRSPGSRPSIRSLIDAHEELVVARTESHRDALHAFSHERRVLVRGAAGTGKTVLVLEAAVRRAANGERVLVSCWNAVLGTWLREAVCYRLQAMGSPVAEAVTADMAGRVVVGHLPGLVSDAASVGVPAGADRQEWYYERLPGWLTPELCAGSFDAVILDEAQDFSLLWLLAIDDVLQEGHLFAFAHANQDLFGTSTHLDEMFPLTYRLAESFRSTAEVMEAAAMLAEPLGDQFEPVEALGGHGPPVEWLAAPTNGVHETARQVARRMQKQHSLKPGDIALLNLFHNPHKGEPYVVARLDAERQGLETNTATYKGMERRAVVLAMDENTDGATTSRDVARAAYVGATRARSLLCVVADPDMTRIHGMQQVTARLGSQRTDA